MNGGWAEFSRQVAHSLLDLTRRVEQLERGVARLDTHGAELAKETLDLIERLDRVDAKVDTVGDSLVAHQDREGRHGR